MGLATRDELEAAFGRMVRRFREVFLPVSCKTVRIQSLSEFEMSSYQRRSLNKRGIGIDPAGMLTANLRLFALCLVDADGNRLFGDNEYDKLKYMDSADSSVLYAAIKEHCGLDDSDLGDIAKNSEKIPGGASLSA